MIKDFFGYKEREQCKNAWKVVDEEVVLKEGTYC